MKKKRNRSRTSKSLERQDEAKIELRDNFSRRDKERAETFALRDHEVLYIQQAEVLRQGMNYEHPVFRPRKVVLVAKWRRPPRNENGWKFLISRLPHYKRVVS